MAVTADSVIVELLAKTDGYTAAINGAAGKSEAGFSKIERTASQAEAQVARSSASMGSSVSKAANDIERGSARAANASRNLGRQISDIGVGLTGGQNPFLILSQQAPQVADALADTGGKAARVAAFFAGPWGAALLAAGSALGILVGKALEGGDTIASLTDKLKDNAERSRLAESAEAAFARSLEGVLDASAKATAQLERQNKSQIQVAQSALAAAAAQRQQAITNLRNEEAAAGIAVRQAQIARQTTFGAAGGTGAGQAAALYSRQEEAATQRLTLARRALAQAERQVVEASVPILRLQGAELADKSAAATGRHERAVNALTDAYRKAQAAAAKLGGSAGNAARAAAVQTYREGVAGANRTLESDQEAIREAKKKGPKGPSAETLAKRAEAARVREIRDNEAFNNELEQLNGQIIAAQRERAVNAAETADFERAAIEKQFRDRQDNIAADRNAGKYSAAQATQLNELNEATRLLRLRNVAIDEDVRTIQEAAQRDALTINLEQQKLESEGQIARSRDERRRIELDLVRLKYEEKRLALEAVRAQAAVRGDINAVNDASEQIDALPALRRNDEIGVEQRNETRYDRYRRSLTDIDDINDRIDSVKVDALEKVTDELTNATTAALGLKGAFGEIVGQLIRIGIQRRLIGPLADALFGAAPEGGGTRSSGAIGSIFGAIAGGIGGRASGGYVAPRGIVKVNEGRGPELLRMGPQGGTVIPLGQTKAAQRQGSIVVQQTIMVDGRNSVTPAGFASSILDEADRRAGQAISGNNKALRSGFPGQQARYASLGTTG